MNMKNLYLVIAAAVTVFATLVAFAVGDAKPLVVHLVVTDQDGEVFNEEISGSPDRKTAARLDTLFPRDNTSVESIHLRSTDPKRFEVRMTVDTTRPAPDWLVDIRTHQVSRDPLVMIASLADRLEVDVLVLAGSVRLWESDLETAIGLTAPPAGLENRELETIDLHLALSDDRETLVGQLAMFTKEAE